MFAKKLYVPEGDQHVHPGRRSLQMIPFELLSHRDAKATKGTGTTTLNPVQE